MSTPQIVLDSSNLVVQNANFVVDNGYLFYGDGGGLSNVSGGGGGTSNLHQVLTEDNATTLDITTTGTVTGGFFVGDGGLLSNVSGGGGGGTSNLHQVLTQDNSTTLDITTTGTVTGGFFVGDGGLLTNVSSGSTTTLTQEHFDARPASSVTLATSSPGTTIVYSTEDINSNASVFSLSSGILTINKTGKFLISYTMTTDCTSGSSRSGSLARLYINDVYVAGTDVYLYNRLAAVGENTGSHTIIRSLTSGDNIRVKAYRYVGSDTIQSEHNGCGLRVVELLDGVTVGGGGGGAITSTSETVTVGGLVVNTPKGTSTVSSGTLTVDQDSKSYKISNISTSGTISALTWSNLVSGAQHAVTLEASGGDITFSNSLGAGIKTSYNTTTISSGTHGVVTLYYDDVSTFVNCVTYPS